VQRSLVAEVADEDVEEGQGGGGVHGLEHQQPARPQRPVGLGEQRLQRVGRQVLGHLGREDAAQRAVGPRAQELDQVALPHVEPAPAALADSVGVALDAAGGDAGLAQGVQELAAAAAEVRHRGRVAEQRDVIRLAGPDLGPAAAETVLEGRVRGVLRRPLRGRCDGGRRACGTEGDPQGAQLLREQLDPVAQREQAV
jgi:hypothetical protein